MHAFNDQELSAALAGLPGWQKEVKGSGKTFRLGSYADHLAFVNFVGRLADRHDHHPDMTITYPQVVVSLWTHTHDGVTEKDVALATEIEKVAALLA